MDRRDFIVAAGSVTAVASASQASEWFMRGAFLDHAVPGVGLTVSGPVHEVTLYFDLGVIAALSSVQVISSTGAPVPTSRPRQRSFRPADCYRQARACTTIRHL